MKTPLSDDPGRSLRLHSVIARYLSAVDQGAGPDREAFLAEHPDLADDLRAYFADHDRIEAAARAPLADDLGTVAYQAAGAMRTVIDSESSSGLGPGTLVRYFGDYELINELGRGGMGVVYRAKQLTLGRMVALKMMFGSELASEDDLKRFQNEAEAVAQLDHPNIVPIIEVGEHLGQKYFSMKLINGAGLDALRDRTVADPRLAATIVSQVARAVHHAHQRGILHRDLKPSNILVDEQDQPHVTDFGLAKRVESDSAITQSGAIMGTPSYMPPEQASGAKGVVTTASDVYGLGAILYDLLTGAPPFRGESVLETLTAVRELDPAPIRIKNPRVGRDLETIALTCLAKDPRRRYASAEAVAEDLERWLKGEPIHARPVSSVERAIMWARRRPAIAGLSAFALLSTLGGLIGISMLYVEAKKSAAAEAMQRMQAVEAEAAALLSAERERQQRLEADVARKAADQSAIRANMEEVKARQAQGRAEELLYVNQINLARQYWLSDQLDQANNILQAAPPPLRGWEWGYLNRSFHSEEFSLPANGQFTSSLHFSRDGKRMASVASMGLAGVVVWDLITKLPVAEFNISRQLSSRGVSSATLSPDGQVVAIGEKQGTISLWDVATAKHLRDIGKLSGSVDSVSFSPDGRLLAAARVDARNGAPLIPVLAPPRSESLAVIEVDTGKVVFERKQGVGVAVDFSPDGKRLLAFKKNSAIRVSPSTPEYLITLWTVDGWKEERSFGPATSWSFSPDGRLLALGGNESTGGAFLKLCDVETGQRLKSTVPTKDVGDMSFSRDGKLLAVAISMATTIEIWKVDELKVVQVLRGNEGIVKGIAFQPESQWLASCASDRSIRFWDPLKDPVATLLPGSAAIYASDAAVRPQCDIVAVVQDGLVGVGSPMNQIGLWDPETGKNRHLLTRHTSGVKRVAFSGDGKVLASGSRDRTIRTWDVTSGQPLATLTGLDSDVQALAVSQDGRWVAFSLEPSGEDQNGAGGKPFVPRAGEVKIWEPKTNKVVNTLKTRSTAYQIMFAADETILVADGSTDVSRFEVPTGALLPVPSVKVDANMGRSPDGKLISLPGPFGVAIVSASDLRQICVLPSVNGGPMTRVAISPDGKRAVTMRFNDVKLWAIPSGHEIMTLPVLEGVRVHGLVAVWFSADGRRIFALGRNGASQAWDSN